MSVTSISIGCDFLGFNLKSHLIAYLQAKGYQVIDSGCNSEEECDYPDFARAACQEIIQGNAQRGILICGSGIGISIAANKVKGIRCALCHDVYTAEMCRQHNDANVIAFGVRIVTQEQAEQIVDAFLASQFNSNESRHAARVEKIMALEV